MEQCKILLENGWYGADIKPENTLFRRLPGLPPAEDDARLVDPMANKISDIVKDRSLFVSGTPFTLPNWIFLFSKDRSLIPEADGIDAYEYMSWKLQKCNLILNFLMIYANECRKHDVPGHADLCKEAEIITGYVNAIGTLEEVLAQVLANRDKFKAKMIDRKTEWNSRSQGNVVNLIATYVDVEWRFDPKTDNKETEWEEFERRLIALRDTLKREQVRVALYDAHQKRQEPGQESRREEIKAKYW